MQLVERTLYKALDPEGERAPFAYADYIYIWSESGRSWMCCNIKEYDAHSNLKHAVMHTNCMHHTCLVLEDTQMEVYQNCYNAVQKALDQYIRNEEVSNYIEENYSSLEMNLLCCLKVLFPNLPRPENKHGDILSKNQLDKIVSKFKKLL